MSGVEVVLTPNLIPVFNATLRIFQSVYELKVIGEETRDLLNTTQHIDGSMNAVHVLRRQKSPLLNAAERAWIDGEIRNTERALSDIAALIEPSRIDFDIASDKRKDISVNSRTTFVLTDSPQITAYFTKLNMATQGLNVAMGVLCNREDRQSVGSHESAITDMHKKSSSLSGNPPPAYELSEMMNRWRTSSSEDQKQRLHYKMSFPEDGQSSVGTNIPSSGSGLTQLRSQDSWTDSERAISSPVTAEREHEIGMSNPMIDRAPLDTTSIPYLERFTNSPACTSMPPREAKRYIEHYHSLNPDSVHTNSIDAWRQETIQAIENQHTMQTSNINPQITSSIPAPTFSPLQNSSQVSLVSELTQMPTANSSYYNPQPHTQSASTTAFPSTPVNSKPEPTIPQSLRDRSVTVPPHHRPHQAHHLYNPSLVLVADAVTQHQERQPPSLVDQFPSPSPPPSAPSPAAQFVPLAQHPNDLIPLPLRPKSAQDPSPTAKTAAQSPRPPRPAKPLRLSTPSRDQILPSKRYLSNSPPQPQLTRNSPPASSPPATSPPLMSVPTNESPQPSSSTSNASPQRFPLLTNYFNDPTPRSPPHREPSYRKPLPLNAATELPSARSHTTAAADRHPTVLRVRTPEPPSNIPDLSQNSIELPASLPVPTPVPIPHHGRSPSTPSARLGPPIPSARFSPPTATGRLSPSLAETEIQGENLPFYKDLPELPCPSFPPPQLPPGDWEPAPRARESQSSLDIGAGTGSTGSTGTKSEIQSSPFYATGAPRSRGKRWLEHHIEKSGF